MAIRKRRQDMGLQRRAIQVVIGVPVLLAAIGCGTPRDVAEPTRVATTPSGAASPGEEGPPGPSFHTPAGWYTDRSGTLPRDSHDLPIAWLSNYEFSQPHFKNLYEELAELPPDGIAIQAILWAPETYPAPPNANFPPGELPLDLDDFVSERTWEGQVMAHIPLYRIWFNVDGRSLEAQVYFGRLEPTEDQYLAAAEALKKLRLD